MAMCRGCGARVVFALDENGRRQILDPRPAVYELLGEDADGTARCRRIAGGAVSHFATCSAASKFSRKKQQKETK